MGLITVPGVGHDNYNIAPFASIYLFGENEEKMSRSNYRIWTRLRFPLVLITMDPPSNMNPLAMKAERSFSYDGCFLGY